MTARRQAVLPFGPGIYYRIQPVGLSLRDHQPAVGDDGERLPSGYTFAFENPGATILSDAWMAAAWEGGNEVVVFRGRDAYDPGDYEGFAVRPGRVLRRFSLEEFCTLWERHPDYDGARR